MAGAFEVLLNEFSSGFSTFAFDFYQVFRDKSSEKNDHKLEFLVILPWIRKRFNLNQKMWLCRHILWPARLLFFHKEPMEIL